VASHRFSILEVFEFTAQPALDRRLVEELATFMASQLLWA
jgi:hypothetical protein